MIAQRRRQHFARQRHELGRKCPLHHSRDLADRRELVEQRRIFDERPAERARALGHALLKNPLPLRRKDDNVARSQGRQIVLDTLYRKVFRRKRRMPRGLATRDDAEQIERYDLTLEKRHHTVHGPNPGTDPRTPAHRLRPSDSLEDLGKKLGKEGSGLAADDPLRRCEVLTAAGRAGSSRLRELVGERAQRATDLAFRGFDDAKVGLHHLAFLRKGGHGRRRPAGGVKRVLDGRAEHFLCSILFLGGKAAEDENQAPRGESGIHRGRREPTRHELFEQARGELVHRCREHARWDLFSAHLEQKLSLQGAIHGPPPPPPPLAPPAVSAVSAGEESPAARGSRGTRGRRRLRDRAPAS